MDINKLKDNVKKKNLSKTSYGKHMYSNLWYVCNNNKLCITFTPRGGCSIAFQQFLDLNDLLKDALQYNSFIHAYRSDIVNKTVPYSNINLLIKKGYTFIKFIMNPYIRAVSIYRAHTSHNFSFRQFLKDLINNKVDYLNENDKYHFHTQYIEGEEKIITKYIKINENETCQIKLNNNTNYILDVNKYTSIHHGVKNKNNTTFMGDTPLNIVNENLPSSYKYFYDDEIKDLVKKFYFIDLVKYKFTFNFK